MSRARAGRPYRDDLALVEEIAALLAAEPDASTRRVQDVVRARRSDVLRVVRSLRRVDPTRSTAPTMGRGSAIRWSGESKGWRDRPTNPAATESCRNEMGREA
jgi:hypothetical protein